MKKSQDRRSTRSKRQRPARFASPTESSPLPSKREASVSPSRPVPNVDSPTVHVSPAASVTPTAVAKVVTLPVKTPTTATAIKKGNILEFPSLRTRPAANKRVGQHPTQQNANAKKPKKRRNSDTSSDEERWLNAIETGKLEDVDDEMKKMKDPKLMTARQRAMYERSQDAEPAMMGFVEELISLPTGYREKEKPQTAEEIQKAALKSQKRKQQADERREKDKQKTMERLLKKQESGKQRGAGRSKQNQKPIPPKLVYRNTLSGAYIMVPPNHEFPLLPQTAREPPPAKVCGVVGCRNRKAYNCSKTNVPLCSLACYRKNLAATTVAHRKREII